MFMFSFILNFLLKCYHGVKIASSVVVLYICVRVVTHLQHFIVWFYTSLVPRDFVWILDTLYFRSTLIQRLFSFRLLDSTATERDSRTVAEDLARKAGLSFESHHITTKDGYILALHRCYLPTPGQEEQTALPSFPRVSRPPVFLMHGFMQDSESFLCGGHSSLACTLATAGHDVWLGNNRGNKYSSRDQQDDCTGFWDFSIDDLARFDFPAAVDYVTQHTQSPSLAYIGFSQGTTQAFAALSAASPDFSEKISLFIALAPAVYPCGFRDSLVSTFFSSSHSGSVVSLVFGTGAMLRLTKVSKRILSKTFFSAAVRHSLGYLFSCHCNNISPDRQTELFQHVYSTSSVKCVQHWLQIIQAGCLCGFQSSTHRESSCSTSSSRSDGGRGQVQSYDVSRITTPVAVIYGATDALVDATAVIAQLGTCCIHAQEVAHFEHLDLIWADNAPAEVFSSVVELLN